MRMAEWRREGNGDILKQSRQVSGHRMGQQHFDKVVKFFRLAHVEIEQVGGAPPPAARRSPTCARASARRGRRHRGLPARRRREIGDCRAACRAAVAIAGRLLRLGWDGAQAAPTSIQIYSRRHGDYAGWPTRGVRGGGGRYVPAGLPAPTPPAAFDDRASMFRQVRGGFRECAQLAQPPSPLSIPLPPHTPFPPRFLCATPFLPTVPLPTLIPLPLQG